MLSPDEGHRAIFNKKPILRFEESADFESQRAAIKSKLFELLGDMPEKVSLDPVIESKNEHETFTEYRIVFNTEKDVQAVCILCIPKLGKRKYPLVVCLQGHGKGMHVSMGRRAYASEKQDDGDRNIALQVLERGYAALCLEQRGMGERRTELVENKDDEGEPRCNITAMSALILGRTLIGERCWDVSRAIDLALTYPEIDGERIACTGNSGGGTATYYAACFDERIKVAMPSCAVCTYKDSIGAMYHCQCNYIPHIAKYMDMGDLAAVIAPRKLIVVNGVDDPIFPDFGVRESFNIIQKIYNAAGVPENCVLTTGNGGHRYYKKNAWDAFDKIVDWD